MRPSALRSLGTIALLAASTLAAHADTFSFSFSGQDSGSGIFTADATSTKGEYLITGISGTFNNSTINGLLDRGSYPSDFPNDNLLFVPKVDGGFLSYYGVAFTIGNNNRNIDLFYDSSSGYFAVKGANQNIDGLDSFKVSRVATTPEPSSLALLGTGVIGAIGAVRRRFNR